MDAPRELYRSKDCLLTRNDEKRFDLLLNAMAHEGYVVQSITPCGMEDMRICWVRVVFRHESVKTLAETMDEWAIKNVETKGKRLYVKLNKTDVT